MVKKFRYLKYLCYLQFHWEWQKNEILHLDSEFLSECYSQYIKRNLPPCLRNWKKRQGERQVLLKGVPAHSRGTAQPKWKFLGWGKLGHDSAVSKWYKDPALQFVRLPDLSWNKASLPCTQMCHRCVSSLFWKETTK